MSLVFSNICWVLGFSLCCVNLMALRSIDLAICSAGSSIGFVWRFFTVRLGFWIFWKKKYYRGEHAFYSIPSGSTRPQFYWSWHSNPDLLVMGTPSRLFTEVSFSFSLLYLLRPGALKRRGIKSYLERLRETVDTCAPVINICLGKMPLGYANTFFSP